MAGASPAETQKAIEAVHAQLSTLDAEISPLAMEAGVLSNPHWGLAHASGSRQESVCSSG